MNLKKWTSLAILIMFLLSVGNINIAKAAETNIFNEESVVNLEKSQAGITTSGEVSVKPAIEIQTEQSYNADLVGSAIKPIETFTYVNPMYKDFDLPSFNTNSFSNLPVLSGTDTPKFLTIADAGTYMRKEMVKRSSAISIIINKPYYANIHKDIFDKAIEYNEGYTSNEGDYLYAHLLGYGGSIYGDSNYVSITYQMSYLSTYEQEQQVNAKVKKVLDALNVYNRDEYTKIKAVHDYIVKNVKYDYSLSKFSAYNAIIENNVVCQGFASLTYKMLKDLGIRVRYITGMGNSSRHGWNIARVNGRWYNIDNTWDENISNLPNISYTFFLKSNADFGDHIRFPEYDNALFNQTYPMASSSYIYSPVKVVSVALNKTSLSMIKGYTSTLTASVLPSNAANKSVTWKSSNPLVATVDTNGKVTGVAAGSAAITATAKDGSGKLATCKVTVTNPIKVTSIALNKTSISVVKGYASILTPTVLPANATNKGLTWKSSNPLVATVDVNGKVTGVTAGSATITAIAKDGSGKLATCKVTVTNPIKVTSIALNKTSLSVVKGYTSTLIPTILPSNATNKGLTWKSNNTAVATVDTSGKIIGVTAGIATITCTAKDGSGKLATCKVTVTNPVKVTSITLSKPSISVVKGYASTLIPTILPANATNKGVTWKSSNIFVATVDANGKVTGVGLGTTTITCIAKDGSLKYVACKVTVILPVKVTSIALSKPSISLVKGNTSTLTATILPSNATNKGVTWKSTNTLVATVDSNGKVIGVGAGTATITCTAKDGSGKLATCKVTVTK